jgi:type I restriction enzyme R subunit
VPPKAVSVPLKFQRQGIKYDDLSEEEKDDWDAIEWDDRGNVPTEVGAEAINKWLFNTDTVDKVLEHLMLRGQKVAGNDLLGKTIIFAKNHQHAIFIQGRFDANYPNEVYRNPTAWQKLAAENRQELNEQVAGMPTELPSEDEEAKRFDLLMLRLQLAVSRADPIFAKLRDQVIAIAEALEGQSSIPMIRERLELIQELQTDKYWQNITAPMLEVVRRRLRDLVKVIEKTKRNRIYTDFIDEIGADSDVEIVPASTEIDFERFKAKAQHFLKAQLDHIVIHKLRRNQPLTRTDLQELEKILIQAAGLPSTHVEAVKQQGLISFIRSLVGLDREAAKAAFASFLAGKSLTASQIEFVNLIIDHLTEHGFIDAERLYESPFTDFSPRSVEGVFTPPQVGELISVLTELRANAG